MSSLNKVQLIGRLGDDPQSKSFNNGGEVVNLRLATSETWKDKQGERQERTEWHTVAIFNEGLGKVAKQFLRKGSKVYLEGQLQTRKWQDQSGADRYSTEVVLKPFRGELVLLDAKGGSGDVGQTSYGQQSRPQQTSGGGGGSAFDADLDDDIPFASCDPRRERRVS